MATKTDYYFKFLELRQNTESNRWIRFNTLLVINGLLIAAWSQLISRTGIGMCIIEILLTVFGAGLSFIWRILSITTNRYHELYENAADSLEEELKIKLPGLSGNFIREREKSVVRYDGIWKKLGTSTFLMERLPWFFVIFFLVLTWASVAENLKALKCMMY